MLIIRPLPSVTISWARSSDVIDSSRHRQEDEELVIIKEGELTVTIEDHFQTGGLYSIVAETLLKNRLTANVLPIALEERWFKPARLQEVLEYEGFTGMKMAKKISSYFEEIMLDDLNDNKLILE